VSPLPMRNRVSAFMDRQGTWHVLGVNLPLDGPQIAHPMDGPSSAYNRKSLNSVLLLHPENRMKQVTDRIHGFSTNVFNLL
jgi:hypothetical protein